MRIGTVVQINGRYLPDGTIQKLNLGIGSLTGQAQTLVCDDGTTRQGPSVRQFLDSAEIVCPPDLVVDAPNGTKANPTPPGVFAIGSKHTFGKSFLLDDRYGSPRQLNSSGVVNPNFGPGLVCGRDKINGVEGYSYRDNLTHREWWSPSNSQ